MQISRIAVTASSLTISEVSSKYDITLRTLRFWEQIGLLSPHRIGYQRHYDAGNQIRVQLVKTGRRLGFSLREIAELIAAQIDASQLPDRFESLMVEISVVQRQILKLALRRKEIDEAIAELKSRLEA